MSRYPFIVTGTAESDKFPKFVKGIRVRNRVCYLIHRFPETENQ